MPIFVYYVIIIEVMGEFTTRLEQPAETALFELAELSADQQSYVDWMNEYYASQGDRVSQESRFWEIAERAINETDDPELQEEIKLVAGMHHWAMWPTAPGEPLPEGLRIVENSSGVARLTFAEDLDRERLEEAENFLFIDGDLSDLNEEMRKNRWGNNQWLQESLRRVIYKSPPLEAIQGIGHKRKIEGSRPSELHIEQLARAKAVRLTGIDPLATPQAQDAMRPDYYGRNQNARRVYARERLGLEEFLIPEVNRAKDSRLAPSLVREIQTRLFAYLESAVDTSKPAVNREYYNLDELDPQSMARKGIRLALEASYQFDPYKVHPLTRYLFVGVCERILTRPTELMEQGGAWASYMNDRLHYPVLDDGYSFGLVHSWSSTGRFVELIERDSAQSLITLKQPMRGNGTAVHWPVRSEDISLQKVAIPVEDDFPAPKLAELSLRGQGYTPPEEDFPEINYSWQPSDFQDSVTLEVDDMPSPAESEVAEITQNWSDTSNAMNYHGEKGLNKPDIGAVVRVGERVPRELCLLTFAPGTMPVPEREDGEPDLVLLFKPDMLTDGLLPQVTGYELIAWDPDAMRGAFRRLGDENPYKGNIFLSPVHVRKATAASKSIGMNMLASRIRRTPVLGVRGLVGLVQESLDWRSSIDPTVPAAQMYGASLQSIELKHFSDFRDFVDSRGRIGVECTGAYHASALLIKQILKNADVRPVYGYMLDTSEGAQISSVGHVQMEVTKKGRSFLVETGSRRPDIGPDKNAAPIKTGDEKPDDQEHVAEKTGEEMPQPAYGIEDLDEVESGLGHAAAKLEIEVEDGPLSPDVLAERAIF